MPLADFDTLLGPEAGVVPPQGGGGLAGMKSKLGGMNLKGIGSQLIGLYILDKILQTRHQAGLTNIQTEGMRRQAEMITPENLYQQAALPQAQQEESMARQALLLQLSGGVIGPQEVARGNKLIG